jgi:hypothetical protein
MDERAKPDFSSRVSKRRRKRDLYGKLPEASKLGEIVTEYITRRVGPRQSYFSTLAGVWDELMPTDMKGHCELTDFSGGRLRIVVDSPVYLYELQLCHNELLRELQRRMRGFKSSELGGKTDIIQPIRRLKFVVGGPVEKLMRG